MLLQPSYKWIQGSEGNKKTSLSCLSGVENNNHGDDRGIKDNLWYLPQEPTHLLWDSLTEPGAHEVGQIGLSVSPREPPISISPVRHSSMYVCICVCTTMPSISTWDWKPNRVFHACKANILYSGLLSQSPFSDLWKSKVLVDFLVCLFILWFWVLNPGPHACWIYSILKLHLQPHYSRLYKESWRENLNPTQALTSMLWLKLPLFNYNVRWDVV